MKSFIYRQERKRETYQDEIIDFYFMNNGKPAFIRGYKINGCVDRDMIKALLSLRADQYKFAVLCNESIYKEIPELFE